MLPTESEPVVHYRVDAESQKSVVSKQAAMEFKVSARLVTTSIAHVLRQRFRTRAPAAVAPGLAFGRAGSARSMSITWIPRGSGPSNPYEVEFDVEYAVESCFLEDEIVKFRAETREVGIGAKPEEHCGRDYSTPCMPQTATSQAWELFEPPCRSPALPHSPQQGQSEISTVVFIHGPSTSARDDRAVQNDSTSAAEVEATVDGVAQSHGLHVLQYRSSHHEQILEWLRSSSPGDKIILNWNERLRDSPTINRALSSARASVIILAPLDVELGSLPASVKGVISGFGTRSLELAIQACK